MKKKILGALAIVLVLCVAVGGTLAYLYDTTSTVTNTFTLGKVTIELDEAKVGADGKFIAQATNRVTDGNNYQLIPGNVYDKDPQVRVLPGSEASYLYIEVVETNMDTDVFDYTLNLDGWTPLDGVDNVYYRTVDKIADNEEAVKFNLLTGDKITIKGTATESDIEDAQDANLKFTAYAIQQANIANAAAGWTAIQDAI